MGSSERGFRFSVWNAHSARSRRAEIESILSEWELDVFCITETWLDPDDVFEFYGYLTYRCDRVGGRGGGSLILFRDALIVAPLSTDGPWEDLFDVVGIRVSSTIGSLNILAVYSTPNAQAGSAVWSALIDSVGGGDSLLLYGDFNAHSPLWGSRFSNFEDRELCSVVLDRGLVPLNGTLSTLLPVLGRSAGNLDLVFYPASRIGTASVRVTGDTHGSDHFLLVGDLSVSLLYCRSNSNRLNTKNVDWSRFHEQLDASLMTCSWAADVPRDPGVVYAEFLALITRPLERCGAYRPSSLPGKRKVQPLWWNSDCDDAIARRRDALKRYAACQTREERARCRKIDGEVKRFLRRQKHLSFVTFCESIDPSVGLTRIWRTVKSLSSRASGRMGPFRSWSSRLPWSLVMFARPLDWMA